MDRWRQYLGILWDVSSFFQSFPYKIIFISLLASSFGFECIQFCRFLAALTYPSLSRQSSNPFFKLTNVFAERIYRQTLDRTISPPFPSPKQKKHFRRTFSPSRLPGDHERAAGHGARQRLSCRDPSTHSANSRGIPSSRPARSLYGRCLYLEHT